MRILVIGKEGQLARSLALAEKPEWMHLETAGRPDLDLSQPRGVDAAIHAFAPDLVVNAAAYTAVDKAEAEPDLAFAVNAEAPRRMAEACAQRDIPLIHISTDYVFDGTKPQPYSEADPVRPLGVYGQSKLCGERNVIAVCPRHIILRTAWVYSPFGQNFVKTMLRLAATKTEISVVDDQLGNPTYAPHLAAAILQIAAQLGRSQPSAQPYGVYHAAGTGEASWCDEAKEVFARSAELGGPQAAVRPITTADYPTPAQRPANSRLDCSALLQTFGIALPEWRLGVQQCIKALLADHCLTSN